MKMGESKDQYIDVTKVLSTPQCFPDKWIKGRQNTFTDVVSSWCWFPKGPPNPEDMSH